MALTKSKTKKKSKIPSIEILFEDTDYVVINKPSGLIVHADGRTDEPALTDWVIKKYPKTKNVGEPTVLTDGTVLSRPGIVHRIDRETSGVLIVAKNQRAYVRLKKQFKRHEVRKIYHAFVYGVLPNKEGRITKWIMRSKTDFRRFTAERGGKGVAREALTYYRLFKTVGAFSFVEVRPHTGRTHQIRVHFRAIGHPIVSDELYASHLKKDLGFKRLALHARTIEFLNVKGKRISVTAPYPTDFTKAIKSFDH